MDKGLKLGEITRKGMWIAEYKEKGFGEKPTRVTKMCTKKQFLAELAGKDPKEISSICNNARFYAI